MGGGSWVGTWSSDRGVGVRTWKGDGLCFKAALFFYNGSVGSTKREAIWSEGTSCVGTGLIFSEGRSHQPLLYSPAEDANSQVSQVPNLSDETNSDESVS